MNILVVEDDEFKRHNVERLLLALRRATPKFAKSIVSALQCLEAQRDFDLIILDMSLPTYDVGPEEAGGRPQGFGGLTVFQHVEALDLSVPVVVLTQYATIGDGRDALDLEGLSAMLQADFPKLFLGIVYYSGGSDSWKEELIALIGGVDVWIRR